MTNYEIIKHALIETSATQRSEAEDALIQGALKALEELNAHYKLLEKELHCVESE